MLAEDNKYDVLKIIKTIQESNQQVKKYFESNFVPFSRSQYYRYCKTLQRYGEEGLYDHDEGFYQSERTKVFKSLSGINEMTEKQYDFKYGD